MNLKDMPTDPGQRWEWLKFQLRIAGTSIAALSRQLRVTDRAVRKAKTVPYPRVERAIAEALELRAIQIWPERWNSDGTPSRRRPNRSESISYKSESRLYQIKHSRTEQSA